MEDQLNQKEPLELTSDKKRCALYIRLSSEDSEDKRNKKKSLSPENQKKIGINYALLHDYLVIFIYQDINRSGGTLDRPGLQKMIERAKEKKFDILIFKDWSRLTRSIEDLRILQRKAKELGITLISCDGLSDPKSQDILTLTNEWFLDECRKKQSVIFELKKKQQIPCSPPPFGYVMPKTQDSVEKYYRIDHREAIIVQKVFRLRSEGKSIDEISKETRLRKNKIFLMLKNKTYCGFNKYAGECLLGRHDPIIDLKLFETVQEKKKAGRTWENIPRKRETEYPIEIVL